MNDLINLIPAKYHSLALFLLAISPYVTRALHSLTSGGGLRGVFSAIWLGTNTPKRLDGGTSVTGGPNQQSGLIRLPILFLMAAVSASLFVLMIVGCAQVQPGQDPIIVNAERVQTIAAPTFDMILELDNSNRPLWQEKVPAFHEFCEWLRQRQLAYLADGTPTNVQRAIAMQLNLDKVKLDYKASKVSSNQVLQVIASLQSVEQQASAWLAVITNRPPTITSGPYEFSNAVLFVPNPNH